MLAVPIFALCAAVRASPADPAWPPLQELSTPSGTHYGIVSGGAPAGPRPTMIALTGAMADTLGCNASGTSNPCYYANACGVLVPEGWLCASLDLPSHGSQLLPGEPAGIAGWRWRIDREQNIVRQNSARVRDMLDDLVHRGLADGARVAAAGISRGGFMAAHYALADARVRALGTHTSRLLSHWPRVLCLLPTLLRPHAAPHRRPALPGYQPEPAL